MPRKIIIRRSAKQDSDDSSEESSPQTSVKDTPPNSAVKNRVTITGDHGERLATQGECRKIQPLDSVYSFLMFTLPLEAKKHKGEFSWRILTSVSLVAITIFVKGVVLYAIFNAVVVKDINWRQSVLDTGNGASFLASGQPKCNTGKSLCTELNGTYTCAPPTVQLMGRWDELDTNGDGVWSHEEAVASQDAIKCKYIVDPVEVFDIFVKFIVNREKLIWVHPDVRAGRKIHKAYFTYASGDLIMCGYRTSQICPNLLKRGVFDAPLRDGVAPRVGKTIDSALKYCYNLLDEGGTCDRSLPSTYTVWKTYTEKQCWGPRYDKFVYKHPKNDDTKSMLTVSYKAPGAYVRASHNMLFCLYKGIIIGLFLLAMYAELKDIWCTCVWVRDYPAAEDFDGEEVISHKSHGLQTYTMQAISSGHRCVVGFVQALRFSMVCLLTWVGVSFLMQDTDWVNLLLNGVALVFVVEIANHVFAQVLDPQMQEEFLSADAMYVETHGHLWLNKYPALRDLLLFAGLCSIMFLLMTVHRNAVNIPISEAVECACQTTGGKCHEANIFDQSFWQKYWGQDVPNVFATVEKLKISYDDKFGGHYGVGPGPAPAMAPSPQPRQEAEASAVAHSVPVSMVVHHRKPHQVHRGRMHFKKNRRFSMANKVKVHRRDPVS